MWERSLGVVMRAVGLEKVREEVTVVGEFTAYLMGCLEKDVRKEFGMIADKYELGLNKSTQKLGILFPEHLVDFRPARPGNRE